MASIKERIDKNPIHSNELKSPNIKTTFERLFEEH